MPLDFEAVKKAAGSAPPLKTLEVDVPEWGGKVLLQELTGAAFDKYQGAALDPKTHTVDKDLLLQRRGRLIQMSVMNPSTGRIMFETERLYIEWIETKLTKQSYDKLTEAAMDLNGLGEGKEEPES